MKKLSRALQRRRYGSCFVRESPSLRHREILDDVILASRFGNVIGWRAVSLHFGVEQVTFLRGRFDRRFHRLGAADGSSRGPSG